MRVFSEAWNEPATGRQKRAIARLCRWLGIKEELEQKEMTLREARDLIYELKKRLPLHRKTGMVK